VDVCGFTGSSVYGTAGYGLWAMGYGLVYNSLQHPKIDTSMEGLQNARDKDRHKHGRAAKREGQK